MKNKYLILFIFNIVVATQLLYKITPEQNQKIRQAQSLYRNGLIDESKKIYNQLFTNYPYLREAYNPLKKILKNTNELDYLEKISNIYIKNNKNSIQSKIDILDAFIWIDNDNWKKLTDEIISGRLTKDRQIKLTLSILLNNKKYDYAENLISDLRSIKTPDFYSYEIAMHYSVNKMIENSITELLLHLEYQPKKYNIIKNRILSFPSITDNQIKSILLNHNSNLSKLILSDIEFRNDNISEAYNLLIKFSNDDENLINFSKDLIQIKEYDFAQMVIENILDKSKNEKIIRESIILLANIFEELIVFNQYDLPLSNQIIKNDLLNSPFIKVNPDKLLFLQKAVNIYDSLRISIKNIESTYHLAEIKYKILGDLDEASSLYNEIIDNKSSSNELKSLSIIKNIDILISKNNLDLAYKTLEENKNNIDRNIYASKEAQILFYLNNWEMFSSNSKTYLKKNSKNNTYYNDILKITNHVTLFNQDTNNLNKYSKALLKSYQNKRTESIEILNSLSNTNNVEIANKIKYELAHLELEQRNINQALLILENTKDGSAFEESILLLKAEIYDHIVNNKIEAINLYLLFLDNFPNSIHYDMIRLRLRELSS